MLSLAALHAERSSALILLVSRSTQSIIYYAKRYSGWQHWVHHCSRLYCCKGLLFVVISSLPPPPPPQVYTRHPLSEKCFKVFLSQRRGSRYSLFLLISCSLHPHREILAPPRSQYTLPLSITAFLLCRRPSEILQCRKATAPCRLFHSPLVKWF